MQGVSNSPDLYWVFAMLSTSAVDRVDLWGSFSAVVALLAPRVGDNDDKFDGLLGMMYEPSSKQSIKISAN